jgi:hypothetical protein
MTPILIVAHRRVATTQQVVDAVIASGSDDVWGFVDGGRNAQEWAQVSEVVELLNDAPWSGQFHLRAMPENVGVSRGGPMAIDWVLRERERVAILEDDCVPTEEFFEFARLMLDRYEEDPRVAVISGTRIVPTRWPTSGAPYAFGSFPLIWGWATWRDRWSRYSRDIRGWRRHVSLIDLLRQGGPLHAWDWYRLFNSVSTDDPWSWDYQLTYMLWRYGQLAVIPGVNLVRNVGFGELASHTDTAPAWAPEPPPREVRAALICASAAPMGEPEVDKELDAALRFLLFSPPIRARLENLWQRRTRRGEG